MTQIKKRERFLAICEYRWYNIFFLIHSFSPFLSLHAMYNDAINIYLRLPYLSLTHLHTLTFARLFCILRGAERRRDCVIHLTISYKHNSIILSHTCSKRRMIMNEMNLLPVLFQFYMPHSHVSVNFHASLSLVTHDNVC